MIVLLGGSKGGSGKSLLAKMLAAGLAQRGGDVLLLDCDRQATATKWAVRRAEQQPDAPAVKWAQLVGDAAKARSIVDQASRYEHCVIDAGGFDASELRHAIIACDLFLIPSRPTISDLETLGDVEEIRDTSNTARQDGGAPAFVVLQACPTHYRVTDRQEASDFVKSDSGLDLFHSFTCTRKSYSDADLAGLGVTETGAGPARDEINGLLDEVMSYE